MELESAILERFILAHPTEAARLLESKPAAEVAAVLTALPFESSSQLLSSLNPLSAAHAVELLDVHHAARDLAAIRHDAAAAILRAMRAVPRASVLNALAPEQRRPLTRLLRYSEGTAGALMDSSVLSIDASTPAGEALQRLQSRPQHALYYIYVVDDAQRLVGVLNLRELMAARPEQALGLQSNRAVESVSVRATSESIVSHPAWKRIHALPVVERDGRFVGVIRYESVRQLEGRLLEQDVEDHAARTATALGEVYALGLLGLFEWGAEALVGSSKAKGDKR